MSKLPNKIPAFAGMTDLSSLIPTQFCPNCGDLIGALPGGRDAVCENCGYKDPCCE